MTGKRKDFMTLYRATHLHARNAITLGESCFMSVSIVVEKKLKTRLHQNNNFGVSMASFFVKCIKLELSFIS